MGEEQKDRIGGHIKYRCNSYKHSEKNLQQKLRMELKDLLTELNYPSQMVILEDF